MAVPADDLHDFGNYPNPFAPPRDVTTFVYTLHQDAEVEIEIYTYLGNRVRHFSYAAGQEGGRGAPGGYVNRVVWDGRDGKGYVPASGGYICRISARLPNGVRVAETRKIAIVRMR